MPVYEYKCEKCGKSKDIIAPMSHLPPECCGAVMGRLFSFPLVKIKYPLWVDRIDNIHKAQDARGERFRYVHPKEVGAT